MLKKVLLLALVFVLGAGAGIGTFLFIRALGDQARVPGEYLYLDNDRVDSYLGQIDNGLSTSEKRTTTTSRKGEASAKAGAVLQVGGSLQEEQFVEQLVTPTATDRFFRFLNRLDDKFGSEFHQLEPSEDFDSFLSDTRDVHEGDFVEIREARLFAPTYALLFPKLTHAARLLAPRVERGKRIVALRQPGIRPQEITRLVARHRRGVNNYLRAVGKDPRVPLVAKAALRPRYQSDKKESEFTFLLPVRYSKLTDAPSLLSGRITIVGKVIRSVQPLDPERKTEDFRDPTYFDIETALTYRRALRKAPAVVRRTIHVPRNVIRARVGFSATVTAAGMVVIPVAMFQ
jgi:hypothetical protein